MNADYPEFFVGHHYFEYAQDGKTGNTVTKQNAQFDRDQVTGAPTQFDHGHTHQAIGFWWRQLPHITDDAAHIGYNSLREQSALDRIGFDAFPQQVDPAGTVYPDQTTNTCQQKSKAELNRYVKG